MFAMPYVRSSPLRWALMLVLGFLGAACGTEPSTRATEEPSAPPAPKVADIPVPNFNADSAYGYIEQQLSFGPRVPNSSGHIACANWLEATLRRHGARITLQPAEVTAYNGTRLYIQNIIASFRPEQKQRIMLSAHWDTRHIAEADEEQPDQPIPGANDGGSGVGVLLEMARLMGETPPGIGVDIFLWDAEDYGDPGDGSENSYCLGSQYWARNPHKAGYRARYGINLDMVGATNATFYQEGQSRNYAPQVVDKVWQTAHRLGYGSYFPLQPSDGIVDDHLYINVLAGIPTIDIIHQPDGTGFFAQWHTQEDDLDVISKETLKAVGQTLLEVVYRE